MDTNTRVLAASVAAIAGLFIAGCDNTETEQTPEAPAETTGQMGGGTETGGMGGTETGGVGGTGTGGIGGGEGTEDGAGENAESDDTTG